jgi:ABC-2 type transport system ATP-binding protein
MEKSIAIEVRGVRKRLRTNQALDGVTSVFEAGMLHGLIGPDGAGKTTLVRTLVGLLKPDEGDILFTENGAPIPFELVRPFMAYMPQQQSLYPDLSVSEHMDFFRDLYQIPAEVYRQRREELLHITRLEAFTDRPASKLSGGMYKKLGLMCALLQSPNVVLLDEPTNGVDPISRREFWDLLYRLTSQGILVLMTTAYMDEAERCDRVHVLEKGKLLAEGEPREIMAREGVTSFEELFLRRAAASSGGRP